MVTQRGGVVSVCPDGDWSGRYDISLGRSKVEGGGRSSSGFEGLDSPVLDGDFATDYDETTRPQGQGRGSDAGVFVRTWMGALVLNRVCRLTSRPWASVHRRRAGEVAAGVSGRDHAPLQVSAVLRKSNFRR